MVALAFPVIQRSGGKGCRVARRRISAAPTKQYYVYIMANRSRTLYTGVTADLEERVYQHKHMVKEGLL
ncbi:MAG: GIY-YIG nuclease family protein [Chloroflexi bacterium]|nr:GIY-YIG nuclease family protein [Chloroflexota bacterium]